jgi:pimeloyl-ACP methyl ester carboxylesterase
MSLNEERFVEVDGGVRLGVTLCGQGTPVVLLHGFPQSSYAWRKYLPALADAGFRAIAPDMRGYERSDKPRAVSAYSIDKLTADVVALIHGLGYEKVHLVAHDWGGAIAWYVAAHHPELIDRLVILNAPHPDLMVRELRRSSRQRRMSWYMFFFQLPYFPERMLTRAGAMGRLFHATGVRRDALSNEDIAHYATNVRKPGAARGMINYYRAAARALLRPRTRLPRIVRPTMVMWGMKDTALGPSLLEGLESHVEQIDVRRIPDASHWIADEKPEDVVRAIVGFLRAAN